jgi:hypothetical protein
MVPIVLWVNPMLCSGRVISAVIKTLQQRKYVESVQLLLITRSNFHSQGSVFADCLLGAVSAETSLIDLLFTTIRLFMWRSLAPSTNTEEERCRSLPRRSTLWRAGANSR